VAGIGIHNVIKGLREIDPEAVVSHIEELREVGGGIVTPAQIVEMARDPNALLHGCFTWDNGEAAESWRKQEARQILRAVRYYDAGKDIGRAYEAVRLRTDDGAIRRGYMESKQAASDPDLRMQVLRQAMRQMIALRKRFQSFSELSGVWTQLEDVAQRYELQDLMR